MICPCVDSFLEYLHGLFGRNSQGRKGEKIISPPCVDSNHEGLGKDQYFELIPELEFLMIYILCLAKWNDHWSFGCRDKNFGFPEESPMEISLEDAKRKIQACGFQGFEAVASELLEKIQQCKPKIKEDCLNFLDCPFQCEFSIDELLEFMSSISASLHNLLDLKADMILDVKVQIESLEDNLNLFKQVVEFAAESCPSHDDFNIFKIQIQDWACRAACVSLLFWVLDVKKEKMARRMDVILSDLQKKISPATPKVTRMHLAVLKASKPVAWDSCLTGGNLVMKFVDFLKDNLQVDPEEDGIQMLFIELIFLTTFLMDRPKAKESPEGKLILKQADAAVNKVASLISTLSSVQVKEGSSEKRNLLLHNFLEEANSIKTQVRKIYAHLFLDPSSFNFPRINALGFIDALLENLGEFSISFNFPKHQIIMLQEELLSLKESNLKDLSILELQNKHKDIKDLWTRIVNVAHNAERVVSSFIYLKRTLWHDILCLSDVIEEVKLIKDEVSRIRDQLMSDIHALNSEMNSNPILPLQANIPVVENVTVGFKEEVEEIRGRLISGSEELEFISVVGMPGLGKTTLAKKVYSDASVQYHFNKSEWCTVSQSVNIKKMLLDILKDVDVSRDNLSDKGEEELAERVYRSLKGQKYLIVMDDIWDVSAWNALKMSFPEDNIGSRIMFTSRNHNVISEAKSGCSPFLLKPLSEEDSWELLEKKLFYHGSCPAAFVQIGKHIVRKCNGLPLAIVLTAGLLKENAESLPWWELVRESLGKLIARKGCTEVLELSYKHLPELLKPCFLYLGSFAEDEEIRVNKLTKLWISEGFVQKHDNKSLEAVAEEYLMDLVARSLVIVAKRSSTGGIKTCGIHDLLHDFCITKGEEERFLKVIQGNGFSCLADTYAHYRVSNRSECLGSFLQHFPAASFIHSILSPLPLSILSSHLDLSYCKSLRVLDIVFKHSTDQFPYEILELVFLRYLAIQCGHIPSSIKLLGNLETLYFRGHQPVDLPLTIWEMKKLRHVHIDPTEIIRDFHDGLPALENVQSFSFPFIHYEDAEMFLKTIPNVRKLKFRYGSLVLIGSCYQIVELDFLSHLESLVLVNQNFLWRPDCQFTFPRTLKKLTLNGYPLQLSEISYIAMLPNLEVLKLICCFNGRTWNVGDEEFLKLKFLKLTGLYIQQLNASESSFPCLESLVLEALPDLLEIPLRFGSILTLKMIQLEFCRSALNPSLRQIQEEQVELGNDHLEVLIPRPLGDRRSCAFFEDMNWQI